MGSKDKPATLPILSTDLQVLADDALKQAAVLREHRHWTGVYCMAGFAVECALKACIAKQTRAGQFPDKNIAISAWNHGLEALCSLRSSIKLKKRLC